MTGLAYGPSALAKSRFHCDIDREFRHDETMGVLTVATPLEVMQHADIPGSAP